MSSRPARGLGRGLGALLGDTPLPVAPATSDGVREIPVDRIAPSPFQPRKSFDAETLEELQRSIQQFGVLVPIIVRPRGDGFEIVAGERRWRACAALRLPTMKAIVRETSDRHSLEVAIVENLQREGLSALEEAAGYEQLMGDYGMTQEQVATRVGKSRPSVANALRLLTLPERIKAMIAGKRLSAGHARALLAAPERDRIALAEKALSRDLSVHALERLVQRGDRAPEPPQKAEASPDDRDFERRLRERFGVRVALQRSGNGGRLEFRFGDERELIDLGSRLLGEDS